MACRLVALDKWPGVRPVGIGETLCRSLAKLFIRVVGGQAKTAFGNLQLFAGLESGIEGATHSVVQRRLEQVRRRRQEGEEANNVEEEEESGRGDTLLNNLTIETAGTEEEAVVQLDVAL